MKTIPLTESEKEIKQRSLDAGRYAFTPVCTDKGFSLGIAIEGIKGYAPTDYHSVDTYDKAAQWAELCNDRRLTREEAARIVISTMSFGDSE